MFPEYMLLKAKTTQNTSSLIVGVIAKDREDFRDYIKKLNKLNLLDTLLIYKSTEAVAQVSTFTIHYKALIYNNDYTLKGLSLHGIRLTPSAYKNPNYDILYKKAEDLFMMTNATSNPRTIEEALLDKVNNLKIRTIEMNDLNKDVQPLDNRIIVKPETPEEQTKGGIIVPDAAKKRPNIGIVMATGPGKLNRDGGRAAMQLKPGDRVMYGKFSGKSFTHEGDDYIIMLESDIMLKYVNNNM